MATSWPDPRDADPRTSRPSLTAILEKVKTLTKATGAAIALATDRDGEIECSVRTGWTAPPLGRSLLQPDSLTAHCLRSGERLLVDDTETDARVAATAVVELGVRSLVLTPIRHEGLVVGVLTIFANVPDAFAALHLAQLDSAAREIGEALEGEGEDDATLSPHPWFPLEGNEGGVAGAPPPAPDSQPILEAVAIAAPSSDDTPTPPEPEPVPERELEEAPPVVMPSFATLDAAAPPGRSFGKSWILLATAALLLVAGGAALWIYLSIGKSLASTTTANRPANAAPQATQSQRAASAKATLRIDPEAIVGHPTATFALDVTISRVQDMASVAMETNYDPNLMEFVSVAEAGFLPKDGQHVVLAHRDDPAAGVLKINAQRPPGSLSVSGDSAVLRLVFRARKKGTGSVSIAPEARDSQGQSIDVPGSHASVTIN